MESARRFFQSIIDSMPSALIGVDRQGRVTHWNRAAENKRGLRPDDAIGQSLFDSYPRLSLQAVDLEKAIDQQQTVSKEGLVMRVDGEARLVDIMVYPLVQQASDGAVVRIDDVTDRVRLEEMMVQTEKMVSVGGLAAGMAHEINNPLGIIAGGYQNILRRVSNPSSRPSRLGLALGSACRSRMSLLPNSIAAKWRSNRLPTAARASSFAYPETGKTMPASTPFEPSSRLQRGATRAAARQVGAEWGGACSSPNAAQMPNGDPQQAIADDTGY